MFRVRLHALTLASVVRISDVLRRHDIWSKFGVFLYILFCATLQKMGIKASTVTKVDIT